MPLDPRLQPFLAAAAAAPTPPPDVTLAERRALIHASDAWITVQHDEPLPLASVQDYRLPVDGGEITVRIYVPNASPPFAAHLYLHGGGFWLGTLDQVDGYCRRLAHDVGSVVASVDYRLAPEHPFPTPAEDCFAALQWLAGRADALTIDADRISVGGASAGGNLAAVTALMARDRGGPPLVLQVLEFPVIDLTMRYPSVRENGTGYLLTVEDMVTYRAYYVGDEGDPTHPYASPMFAKDLAGLPPAVVMTAEFDPLRDEGEAYAARLSQVGVPVEYRCWEGMIHGFAWMNAVLPDKARAFLDNVTSAMRDAFRVHAV